MSNPFDTPIPGASPSRQARQAKLAEMYRAPSEIIHALSWDEAQAQGEKERKWILVNIQDPSVFRCQVLNRDIWKHEAIQATIRPNFLLVQYDKGHPSGTQYLRHYQPASAGPELWPHMAIVHPLTGKQVKTWSGPPPTPADFGRDLDDFLHRYRVQVRPRSLAECAHGRPRSRWPTARSTDHGVENAPEEKSADDAAEHETRPRDEE